MNSRIDTQLIINAGRIRDTPKHTEIARADVEFAEQRGAEIARILMLRPDPDQPDQWLTQWGNKSNIGLARTVLSIMESA